MPFQHLRQQPSRSVFNSPFLLVRGKTSEKALHKGTHLSQLTCKVLASRARLNRRARQRFSCLDLKLTSPIFQPIPQFECRKAIIPIVTFDRDQQLADILQFTPESQDGFEGLKSPIGLTKRDCSRKAIKRLQ